MSGGVFDRGDCALHRSGGALQDLRALGQAGQRGEHVAQLVEELTGVVVPFLVDGTVELSKPSGQPCQCRFVLEFVSGTVGADRCERALP